MIRRAHLTGRGGALAILWFGVALLGCGNPEPGTGAEPPAPSVHRGPVLLVTFSGLRADALGPATPSLQSFAESATWRGTAIAASTRSGPSLATLATGLQPWSHGVLHYDRAGLGSEYRTLAEAFRALGFTTGGYSGGRWFRSKFGLAQGFETFAATGRARRAAGHLESLERGPTFLWIDLDAPRSPYVHRPWLEQKLDRPLPPDLPERLTTADLQDYRFDSPAAGERLSALYRLNAAYADTLFERLISALDRSGLGEETLVVATSLYGDELGEEGRAGHGQSLARGAIEVPLWIRFPQGWNRPLAVPENQPVAAARLWATLVEAAGGEVPPAIAPSLFRPAPAGALSELYRTETGENLFSWVEDDRQLVRRVSFPPDAFATTPAFIGSGPVAETSRVWLPAGRVETISDGRPEETPEAAHMAARWRELEAAGATPEQLRRERFAGRNSRFSDGIVSPSPGRGFWVHSSAVRASGS